MQPRFNFDAAKNASNLAKHGLALTDGIPVLLGDPRFLLDEIFDEKGEERTRTTGPHPSYPGLLVVIHHFRSENLVRLISVRRATTSEEREYAKKI